MTDHRSLLPFTGSRVICFALTLGLCLSSAPGWAVETISFSPTAAGVDKSVPTWGVDVAQANYDEVRRSIESIGPSNVQIARVLVYFDEPLVNNGGTWELNAAAKAKVNNHLNVTAQLGSNPTLTLGTSGYFAGQINPSYLSPGGNSLNVTQYTRAIKATQEYINTQSGFTGSSFYAIEPFNEPDFLIDDTYANPADLNSVIAQLKGYSEFQNTHMMAASVLNSDEAQGWYNQVPQATAGSSHLLAGSFTSYTNFITNVNNSGKPFMNPEIHSMGEILAGADRGMEMGMVWGAVLRGRGTLIQASDGDRLAYGESLATNSAGAVYRAPDGNLYAFAGGVERDYMGAPNAFRFVSDTDVYFNGIKVREYMLQTKNDEFPSATDNDFENYGSASSEGAFVDIDLDGSGIPALDGYRWKIVNVGDNSVMEVAGGGTADGALIRSASDNGSLRQLWNITRTRNGYIHLYNANSGKTAEVENFSLANGADVRQWGTADNSTQQWYVEEAGSGAFYIRGGHSNKYLDADLGSTNIFQWQANGQANQKWRFVLANPTDGPHTHYTMQGNTSDTAGSNHGTAFGGPSYTTGPTGTANSAILLDGNNDYVTLPSGTAATEDLTISSWVKWDGGGNHQRIFDFGTDTDNNMFLTPMGHDNKMVFSITTDDFANEQVLVTDPLPTGQWVHLTLTLGGNTGILYINGEPQVAGQILFDPIDFSHSSNFIGKSQWTHDPLFDGAIADFKIFDYALHPDQVAELVGSPDADGNGVVDGLDLLMLQRTNPSLIPAWQTEYNGGNGGGGGGGGGGRITAVPEPAAGILLLATVGVLSVGRFRL